MQADQLDVLNPFIIERLRAGDDLRDGIVLRARELLTLPARPMWSNSNTLDGSKRAWVAHPLPARRDETGEDWARMLTALPRSRHHTDLADFRGRDGRPFFFPLLGLLNPLNVDLIVSGVGEGATPPKVKPGIPRARAAGVAALRMYWSSVSRFVGALEPDVAWMASETLHLFLNDQLSSRSIGGLNEMAAERALLEARRKLADTGIAARVFEKHAEHAAPDLADMAHLFAFPSPAYRSVFASRANVDEPAIAAKRGGRDLNPEEVAEVQRRKGLRTAYARGGAFGVISAPLERDPTPGAAERALEGGTYARSEGDRETDAGLNPTVPIVVGVSAMRVPRSASRLRARLTFDGEIVDEDERPATESRHFRWMRVPKGGSYRVTVEALDDNGAIIGSGSSGELRVRQFAHCARCPERIDFSEPHVASLRECRWKASPKPGTPPTTIDSDDFEFLARYGENERVRRAASTASREGRVKGKLLVAGEPAALAIDYIGIHSPNRRLPDLPRIADTGELVRGSLVVEFEKKMLEVEAQAEDRTLPREDRDHAVDVLTHMLGGEDASESHRSVSARLKRTAGRLKDAAAAVFEELKRVFEELDQLEATSAEPEDATMAEKWRQVRDWDEMQRDARALPDVGDMSKEELEATVANAPRMRIAIEAAKRVEIFKVDKLLQTLAKLDEPARAIREFWARTVGDLELLEERKELAALVDQFEVVLKPIRDPEELTKMLEEGKAKFDEWIEFVDVSERDASGRLAAMVADRAQQIDADAWNARAGQAVADLERVRLPESAAETAKLFVARLNGELTEAGAKELDLLMTQKARDYENEHRRVAELYRALDRLSDRPPPAVDRDLLARIADSLAEKPAKLDPWDEESRAAAQVSTDVTTSIGDYFAANARVEAGRADAQKIADLLASEELASAADYDAQIAEIEEAAQKLQADVQNARDRFARAVASAKRIDATLIPEPESPIDDYGDLLEEAERKRAEFERAEETRARESEEEGRQRREQEFENSVETANFLGAAEEVETAQREFKERRVPPKGLETLKALTDDISDLKELLSAVSTPAGADIPEQIAMMRPVEDRLEAIEAIMVHPHWQASLAADLVRLRTSNYTRFLQKSPSSVKAELERRVGEIDLAIDLNKRTSEQLPSFSVFAEELVELRDDVMLSGETAHSRMALLDQAGEFIVQLNESIAALEQTPPASDDLATAVDEVNVLLIERAETNDALGVARDELAKADGEHAARFAKDEKREALSGKISDTAKLFVDYTLVLFNSNQTRWNHVVDLIESSPPEIGLREIKRLREPQFATLDEVLIRLTERQTRPFADLEARIVGVPVPEPHELEANREAAIVSFEVIEAIRSDLATVEAADVELAKPISALLRAKDLEVRNLLNPARSEALSKLHRAMTISSYGGRDDDFGLEALAFLERDRALYGNLNIPNFAADATQFATSLDRERGRTLALDKRCEVQAFVRPLGDTCALDVVAMFAAKADPLVMGRMRIVLNAKDDCAKGISRALGKIDEDIQAGRTAATGCGEIRNAMRECAKTDDLARQLLFGSRIAGQTKLIEKRFLDVAEIMTWLNSKYEIELAQLFTYEHVVPDPEISVMPEHDIIKQLSWPYNFSRDDFAGAEAIHEVVLKEDDGSFVTVPRLFALTAEAGQLAPGGILPEILAKQKLRLDLNFVRWGWIYELIAIVHHAPGHYWITLKCGEKWFRYNALAKPVFAPMPGNDPRDAITRKTMHILVYKQTTEIVGRGLLNL